VNRLSSFAAAFALAAAWQAHAALFDDEEARKRIDEVKREQQAFARETDARLGRIEESVRNIGVVELLRQIEALNAEVARLRGQIEVLANQNDQLQKKQRDFYLDLDSRMRRLEGGAAPASGSAPATVPAAAAMAAPFAAPPAAASVPAQVAATAPARTPAQLQAQEMRSYDAASNLFRKNDFAGAVNAFRAFVLEYPQSQLAPNAEYWIGISFANLKDYKNAVAVQEALLKNYPQSPKASDALLAIAAVQAEQGDVGSARNTLEDIIARFPASEAAGKARTRLAALKR
jgi:tol-pal system protein YbgF